MSTSPAASGGSSSGSSSSGGERAVPFYCPYCGEEDLEPVGERGGWWCHSCNRRFVVRLGVPDPQNPDSQNPDPQNPDPQK